MSRCLLVAALAPGESPAAAKKSGPVPELVRYFGQYELLEEVARGGMGIVYRARQASLRRTVALKMMISGALASEVFLKRFRTEAESAAQLSHPNIVPIYEVGEHEGQQYFTMQLIEGCTLAEKLKVNGRFAPEAAVELMEKMARAVHYAHERGVLHRDLKPGNVLLDAFGEPFVADFGLAKLLDDNADMTRTEAILGTINYMSPEQAAGKMKQLTTASDLHSLGVILYEMITGRLPFAGQSNLETLRKIIDEEPPLGPLRMAADRDLRTICLKCLEKEPERRYRSAEALAEDLRHWLRGEPISARPGKGWERLGKWIRRRPALAGLSAISILLLVTLGIGSTLAAIRIGKAKEEESIQRAMAEGTLEQLRRNAYAAEMNIAFHAFESGDRARAAELLQKQPGELRSWDWRYLSRQTEARELFLFTNLPQIVTSMSFSPDGSVLATQLYGNLHLWDFRTKTLLTNFITGSLGDTVEFSPDGKIILTAHRGTTREMKGKLRLWDARSGAALGNFDESRQPLSGAAFSPDGRFVVSAAATAYSTIPGELKLWEVATRKLIREFAGVESYLIRCDYSPDGKLIAAGGGGRVVKIWDAESGRVVARLPGHEDSVFALKFSPNGRWLATGDMRGRVRLWDLSTLEPIVLGSHRDSVDGLAFSNDGLSLVSVSRDHTVKLWSTGKFKEQKTFLGHEGRVTCVAVAHDGTIVSGSRDRTARCWSSQEIEANYVFATHEGMNVRIGFSPDGRTLARHEIASRTITVWDFSSKRTITAIRGLGFAFLPDSKSIAVTATNMNLELWNLRNAQRTSVLKSSATHVNLAISPAGDLAAATQRMGE